jgi:hypothetical protein
MITDRIREDMSVIGADDRCVGFVCGVEGDEMLRVTSITAGYGYDHALQRVSASEGCITALRRSLRPRLGGAFSLRGSALRPALATQPTLG